jgi:RimJ/RimL family protein N-acetyltransferase
MSHEDWVFLSGKTASGASVTLRPIHTEDTDLIGRWGNSEKLRQALCIDYPRTYENIAGLVRSIVEGKEANPSSVSFAISVEKQFIGCCGLYNISLCHRHAILGMYIGDESFQGVGIGSTVYTMLLNYGFRELDLRIVKAQLCRNNISSQKLHEKMGFVQTGCDPEWEYVNGNYEDLLTYCIIKTHWVKAE